ncbi:MAG: Rpn family recombination-promoting nuclease/putative transposase [Lachnospiraceae bacterium]|nr:Rpn family recombination-promoting nuclease/putative transposase [Lachnospiraceae bacterium]
MGQKNNVMCSYLSIPAVFADFVNGSIHNGKKVVHPEQLSTNETIYYQKENPRPSETHRTKYIERQRDTLKTICNNNRYIIIGIEAQDKVNYTMPLRCMEYDIIEYKKQLKELGRSRKKKLTDTEYLSGIARNEKLNPVTTIVFYHGEDLYDGCINLHDMLELNEGNKAYKHFIADYHINLVKVEDLDETLFQTGLHELIGFLKHRNDKQGLINFMEQNKERIENMDEETLDTVNIMLNIPASITKQKDNLKEEDHNLCKALKEWLADERSAGIAEGKKEGWNSGRKEGEKRFASLTAALIAANRLNDLARSTYDESFRDILYQEYAL